MGDVINAAQVFAAKVAYDKSRNRNAGNGKKLWTYDDEVELQRMRRAMSALIKDARK